VRRPCGESSSSSSSSSSRETSDKCVQGRVAPRLGVPTPWPVLKCSAAGRMRPPPLCFRASAAPTHLCHRLLDSNQLQ
jgi:hypothetical protein